MGYVIAVLSVLVIIVVFGVLMAIGVIVSYPFVGNPGSDHIADHAFSYFFLGFCFLTIIYFLIVYFRTCKKKNARLKNLENDTLAITGHLEKLLADTGICLNIAEKEFQRGAFSPFWDAIEIAMDNLTKYYRAIEEINANSNEYVKLSGERLPICSFGGALPDARLSAVRLAEVVRRSQTNFQFTMIYEQRKTNQQLGGLIEATVNMQYSITSSLESLSDSLNTSLDSLISITERQSETLDNIERNQKL